MSPDGSYIASGSETGSPFVWNVLTGELHSEDYECKFMDTICDIDWNRKYNMIACSGFGH